MIKNSKILFIIFIFILIGCKKKDDDSSSDSNNFTLSSKSFTDNGIIPIKYAHTSITGGRGTTPSFSWKNPPEGTKFFIIYIHDKDSDYKKVWGVLNLPITKLSIEENYIVKDGEFMTDYFGRPPVGGSSPDGDPAPAGGGHRFVTTIYAMKKKIEASETIEPLYNKKTFEFIKRHSILGKASYTGIFRQP